MKRSNEKLLAEILRNSELQQAPSITSLSKDHRIVTVAIGKDHHASIIIHENDLAELERRAKE